MSSCESVGFHKFCRNFMPFLLKKCEGHNLHYIWDRKCWCIEHEQCGDVGGCKYTFSFLRWKWLRDDTDYSPTWLERILNIFR